MTREEYKKIEKRYRNEIERMYINQYNECIQKKDKKLADINYSAFLGAERVMALVSCFIEEEEQKC